MMGLFVVFEGVEGSGKSTQSGALAHRLQQAGVTVAAVHEPGSTVIGEEISRLLKTGDDIDPLSELFLFSAARSLLIASVIAPALERGDAVVCDRYIHSTAAYQGYGRGLDIAAIHKISNIATRGIVPDLTVLLDLPPEEGLGRKTADTFDRFEREAQEFHRRVRAGYLELAEGDPNHWLVLDARDSEESLSGNVWRHVWPLVESRSASQGARP